MHSEQDKLRELVAKWRTEKWQRFNRNEAESCADELEAALASPPTAAAGGAQNLTGLPATYGTEEPRVDSGVYLGISRATAPLEQAGTPNASHAFYEWVKEASRRYSLSLNPRDVFIAGYAAGQSAASAILSEEQVKRIVELHCYHGPIDGLENGQTIFLWPAMTADFNALLRSQPASAEAGATPTQTCSKCGGKTWFTANGLCEKCSPDVNAASSATR